MNVGQFAPLTAEETGVENKIPVAPEENIPAPEQKVEAIDKKESWQERRKQLVNLRDNLSRKADEQNKQDPSFPPAEYDSRVEEINSVIESGDLVNRKANILKGNTQEKLEEIHKNGMAEVLKKYHDLIPSETTRKSEGKIGKTEDSEKVKEPWKMTKEEYYQSNHPRIHELIEVAIKNGASGTKTFKEYLDGEDRKFFVNHSSRFDSKISHYREIKKALSEGMPVPPEVLKDYPDLVPKNEGEKIGKTEDSEKVKKAIKSQLVEYKAELINRLASLTKEKAAAKSTRETDRLERLISTTETELDRYLREKTLPQDRIDSIRSVHDDDGKFISYAPTTDHYVFGKVGGEISGGFYVKTGVEAPEFLEIEIKKGRRITV